jgi:anti-sigma factor RsiW
MNCKTCQSVLPDLLLGPASPAPAAAAAHALGAGTRARNAEARAHITSCAACARDLASLQATFALLDAWQAPEISPYFDQKLTVLLREEQYKPAAGWFEQLRTRLLLNTGRQFRPALAGALAVLLIVGGGGFGVATFPRQGPVQASATVEDLQILDNNEQTIQQMDQLLQEDTSTQDNAPAPPHS